MFRRFFRPLATSAIQRMHISQDKFNATFEIVPIDMRNLAPLATPGRALIEDKPLQTETIDVKDWNNDPTSDLLWQIRKDIAIRKEKEATESRTVKAYWLKGSDMQVIHEKFEALKQENPELPNTSIQIITEKTNINLLGLYQKRTVSIEALVLLSDKSHLVGSNPDYVRSLAVEQNAVIDLYQERSKQNPSTTNFLAP